MQLQECIDLCSECHTVCIQTLTDSLEKGEDHIDVERLCLLQDCADICRVSVDFMLRESPQHSHTCRACGEVSALCAEECRKMENDEQMQYCAEICERCAESCRSMAAMTA
jgi:hypothetical protein